MDEKKIDRYNFLKESEGTELFAKLDTALKSGVHIQKGYTRHKELYHYLCRFQDNIRLYYRNLWGIELAENGIDTNHYFYLQFHPDLKTFLPSGQRVILEKEHIIVGLLLYKAYYIDHNLELNSLRKFQRMIRIEYPDMKAGILKTLAKARFKQEKSTLLNDEKIDKWIASAFKEFNKIKWIDMVDDDTFNILPAFQRITQECAGLINRIDELLKEEE